MEVGARARGRNEGMDLRRHTVVTRRRMTIDHKRESHEDKLWVGAMSIPSPRLSRRGGGGEGGKEAT